MPTPNFVHGKSGRVTIGGSEMAALQYDFTDETDLEDITYTQSTGATAQILIPGYEKASGSISFVFDTNNLPAVTMKAGTLMTLVLYPEGTKAYSFQAYSGSFRFSSGPQAGAVKCTTSFRSTGPITQPTS